MRLACCSTMSQTSWPLKSTIDGKYYAPLVGDVVGLIHVQSGILNHRPEVAKLMNALYGISVPPAPR